MSGDRENGDGETPAFPIETPTAEPVPAEALAIEAPGPELATEPVRAAEAEPAYAPPVALPAPRPSDPPRPNILEVRGLSKRYGNVEALTSLDLSVRRGEVYGFLGRNGAGKSTTIRILMGITEKTGGTVALFGEPPGRTDLVRARQRIGYVAQEQTFYGWMTPAQLGRFVGAFYPTWDPAELIRLGKKLDVPLDRKIQTFSGGMKVKVALAIALSHRPELLLLDEPTAGLDPVARREFLEIVSEESAQAGRTTFFSSHLIDEVEQVSHRVGIVDGGRMRYESSVRDLSGRLRLVSQALSPDTDRMALRRRFEAYGFVVHAEAEDETLARFFVEASAATTYDALAAETELGLRIDRLPLEEIFLALVRRKAPALPKAT